jgi:hypothetical protein
MILNTAPANEAIVSNVGEIGEFRIRNSAKAFSILSSGLYANKVRAIIRELSCNAVDSHVAAGKYDLPFDVHLPNQLEPWFAIRDYGTGLSHDQVTNIYTTYFESTKTGSNDYIGALGLGSKSPFSYTDNFTVTAVKDGIKGIYTAFINNEGVPSIALMAQENTDEPAGVEIKFSVNDRYDYDKFRREAQQVYRYFQLKPNVTGYADFKIPAIEYDQQDIIAGVHSYKDPYANTVAIMGNIAYPIEVPESDKSLENLRGLLRCGLELHFDIGELDFQASREGLSYIPQTIEAIKNKLTAVNDALTGVLAKEADAIPNLWNRSLFLQKKYNTPLWNTAVKKYVADTKLTTFDDSQYGGGKTFKLSVADLASKYNIVIRGFDYSKNSKSYSNRKQDADYGPRNAQGHYDVTHYWSITVASKVHFVVNDTNVGAVERAKYHYRNSSPAFNNATVFVLDRANKDKVMDVAGFFAEIQEPPNEDRFLASTLSQKPKHSAGRNVTILKLERRGGGGYRRDEDDMVWRDAGDTSKFDDNETFYYIPLSGFVMESKKGYTSGKSIYEDVKSLPGLFSGEIYGVRKKDIEEIKKRPNWKNFEDHIEETLNTKDTSKLLMSLVRSRLEGCDILNFENSKIFLELDENSPYVKFVSMLYKVDKFTGSSYNIENLFRKFAPNAKLDPSTLISKYQKELNEINRRYPLLTKLATYRTNASDIAEYVNLIDQKKGI